MTIIVHKLQKKQHQENLLPTGQLSLQKLYRKA